MQLPRKDIIQDLADLVTKEKSSPEGILLAEIIRQTQKQGYIAYTDFYKYAPVKLGISKDSYRRTMASLKKKKLISKHGFCIKLWNHEELMTSKRVTEITINQLIEL